MVMSNLLSRFDEAITDFRNSDIYKRAQQGVPYIEPSPVTSAASMDSAPGGGISPPPPPVEPDWMQTQAQASAMPDYQPAPYVPQAEMPVLNQPQDNGGFFGFLGDVPLPSFGGAPRAGNATIGDVGQAAVAAADYAGGLPIPQVGAGMGASAPSGATVADTLRPIPEAVSVANYVGDRFGDALVQTAGMGTGVAPGLEGVRPSTGQLEQVRPIGEFIGQAFVPTTPIEFAAAPFLGLTPADDALMGAGRAALRGGRAYLDDAARVGLGAIPEGAVARTVAPPAPLSRIEVPNAPANLPGVEMPNTPILRASPTEGVELPPVAGGADQVPDFRQQVEGLQPGKSQRMGDVQVSRDVTGVYSVGYPGAGNRISRTEKGLSVDDVMARIEGGSSAPTSPIETAPPARPATAVAEPPAPPSAPVSDEFAGNIRLSKYPEDIRGSIAQWAADHPDEVSTARRGVIPDEQVRAEAESLVNDLGGDFSRIQRNWKPGEAWNAEEVTAIRGALRDKTQQVVEAARIAQADNSAANHANLLLAMQEQARIQEIVTGVTAESGRALRAFRQEAFDATTANDARRLEELLRRVSSMRGVKGTGRDSLDNLAEMVAGLDLSNPVQVNKFIRDISKPRFGDYIFEVWINSVLSGPKTHIVNAVSNTFNAMMSPIERAATALVDVPVSRIQGRPRAAFFSEIPADAYGAVSGISDGVQAALRTLRDGISPGAASKWEFRKTAIPGPAGTAIRLPTTALEAADQFFYAVNYRAALGANAVRQARKEGLTGQQFVDRVAFLKDNPNENLLAQSKRVAEERLFRGETGEITNAVMNLREKVPGLRYILPFVKTPANILKAGIQRSPLGLYDGLRSLRAGSPEASEQIARSLLGSGVAASLVWAIGEGNITGAVPTNSAERDRFYREGKVPFAFKVGDQWIQWNRMEPYNVPLTLATTMTKAIDEGNDKAANEIAAELAATLGNNLVNQTYLSGLSDFIDTIKDPGANGERFGVRTATGLVPYSGALRTAAQAMDPVVRDPEGWGESFKANLPFLSEQVPARLTAFGEEATRKSPAWSPIQVSPDVQSAVDAELERLGMEVTFVGDSIGGRGLNREQQALYQKAAGQFTYWILSELSSRSAYVELSDSDKAKIIDRAITKSRDQVRDPLGKLLDSPQFQELDGDRQNSIIDALLQQSAETAGTLAR